MAPKRERPADDGSASANGVDSDGGREEKRQRTSSAAPYPTPTAESWRQPQLSSDEKQKLVAWLDKLAAHGQDPFVISYPKTSNKANGRGKKGQAARKKQEKGNVKTEHLKLDNSDYGDVSYTIGNREKWDQLTKYRRCTVSEQTFVIGGCVFVRCDEDDEDEDEDDSKDRKDETLSQWKAQILEVRALDENHVYLRVSWLYRPQHDLPGGAQPHHGKYELIPSTEMQIIDAKTINGPLHIKHWDEYQEDDVHNASEYFWRQSYDHTRQALTAVRSMCSCGRPQNPDRPIVQCSNCSEWLHAKCLEAAILDTYLAGDWPVAAGQQEHSPKQQSTSKPRQTLTKDISSETKMDGVTAVFKAIGKLAMVCVTDTRGDQAVVHEGQVKCLSCRHQIE